MKTITDKIVKLEPVIKHQIIHYLLLLLLAGSIPSLKSILS